MEMDPASSLYRYEMGNLFYDKEDYAEAVARIKKGWSCDPTSME